MKQIEWLQRKFYFVETQNIFPGLIERLAGTPARIEEKIQFTDPGILSLKFENSWSVKENIGHLIEVESLWKYRLQEILDGQKEMRAADLTNKKTFDAHYDQKPVDTILRSFRECRNETVVNLKRLNENDIFKSAIHPRLKQPMRIMDLFIFVAEHDDHHLARISELQFIFANQLKGNNAGNDTGLN